MGHFSHSCYLSGLPITGGDPAVLIVMKPLKNIYDNSEESLKKYGKTYLCSNNGPRLKFVPCWFPIIGKYDDYGGIEEIQEDDNTKILEEFYGLPIQKIVNIITSGRKDDGYDEDLRVIKEPVTYPEGWIKGEDHFHYYQRTQNKPMPFGDGVYPDVSNKSIKEKGYEGWTIVRDGKRIKATKKEYDDDFKLIHEHYAEYQEWCKENPDPEDDYNKPKYQEKFKELLTLSGMWVHGDMYKKLTNEKTINTWHDHLHYGTPELLKSLGFEELPKNKSNRYNRPFKYGNLTVYSDGTWLVNSVYSVDNFKQLAKEAGEDIDFSIIETKDYFEQMFDIVVPNVELPKERKKKSKEEYKEIVKGWLETFGEEKTIEEVIEIFEHLETKIPENILFRFLNTDVSYTSVVKNPLSTIYLKAAIEGKLRDNFVRFWRFDNYMYSCGRYYDIVGTAPQDGEYKNVLKVAQITVDVLTEYLKEYEEDEI